MRYYSLTVGYGAPGAAAKSINWTTHPNGITSAPDPDALELEFDFVTSFFDTPAGGAGLTLYGASLEMVQQAQMFSAQPLTLSAGMGKGLPLANPKQAGPILIGTINQAFGNWIGTEQSLSFIVLPSKFTLDAPGNIVLNWQPQTTLAAALANTFSIAYPGMKQSILISPNYVNTASVAQVGIYPTLEALASAIDAITGGAVSIWIMAGQIYANDFFSLSNPVQLAFTDLTGQPTWWAPNQLQFKTVLRADLGIGSVVTMPQGLQNLPGIATTTAQSQPSYSKYSTAFQGKFLITQVEHVGRLRDPSAADGWVSVFNAIVPASAS